MKPRRRILHVIDHTDSGGAQVVVRDLIRALKDQFTFTVAVLGRSGHFSDDYAALGVPVYRLGNQCSRWNPAPLLSLIELIRHGRYDLIHTQLFKSNILGTIAAKVTGRRAILHDQTGMYPQSLQHYFANRLLRNIYLAVYRYALGHCDQAIVLTPGTLHSYTQYYSVAPQKIAVVPNAVDIEHFRPAIQHPAPGSLRDDLGLPANIHLIVMIGRLEPEKDWLTFLDVAQRVRRESGIPCAFLIVGTGSEERRLQEYVRDHHLDHVHLVGYWNDIAGLLHQANVFLLTSRREPFGIVVVEAMAAGCPVVATRSGGPDSILTDGVDGLLANVGDGPGLAGHVIRLLQDEELRERLVKRAQQTVAEHYSLEVVATRIADIYAQILHS